MGIEGISFDLEGTIIDLERWHFEAIRRVAEEVGVRFDPNNLMSDIASKIENAIGGGDRVNSEGIWRLSNKKVSVGEISRRKASLYNALVETLAFIEPRPGFLEVLKQICGLGLKVAIASLTERDQAEILLARSGIGELFPPNCILLGDSVKNLKPAPDVYLEAARRMGIQPAEQLVFEDSATGLTAARLAGSQVIAMPIYTFPENIQKLQEAGAFRIFGSWEEVNVRELLQELNELNAGSG